MRGSLPITHKALAASSVETEDAEDALVARSCGDPQAFAPLYDRYFDAVYRYCYHRLGSWDAAEDAASLVFTNEVIFLVGRRLTDPQRA